MRAFRLHDHSTPPSVDETKLLSPGKGEIRVKIFACGLNFADLLMARGSYQAIPPLPATLGLEPAGIIDAVGPDVTGLAAGDRVAVRAGHGGMAEYGVFRAVDAVRVPDAMPFEIAAGFMVAYGTSHLGLTRRARLRSGERLVVLGAAGGVGLTAVEIGAAAGAEVVAVARGADKLEIARQAGAHHLIDSETTDLRAALKDLGGADVVYDAVGGDLSRAALRACRPEARILVVGFASGDIPSFPPNHLLVKNVDVLGFYWGGYADFAPEVLTESLATLMEWYEQGRLSPHVSRTFPLDQAPAAMEFLASRRSTGKVVVTMGW